MNWLLFLVMLTPSGELVSNNVDAFETEDECYYAMQEIASQLNDERPYNWDFVCLENTGIQA